MTVSTSAGPRIEELDNSGLVNVDDIILVQCLLARHAPPY